MKGHRPCVHPGGIGSFPRFLRQANELGGGSQLGHARFHLGGNLESSWYHRSVLIWVFAVENAIPLVLGNPGLKRWLPGGLSDRLLEVAEP